MSSSINYNDNSIIPTNIEHNGEFSSSSVSIIYIETSSPEADLESFRFALDISLPDSHVTR
jgi:hypothetical protein